MSLKEEKKITRSSDIKDELKEIPRVGKADLFLIDGYRNHILNLDRGTLDYDILTCHLTSRNQKN